MHCSAVYKHKALGEFLRTLKAKPSRVRQTCCRCLGEQVGKPQPWQEYVSYAVTDTTLPHPSQRHHSKSKWRLQSNHPLKTITLSVPREQLPPAVLQKQTLPITNKLNKTNLKVFQSWN